MTLTASTDSKYQLRIDTYLADVHEKVDKIINFFVVLFFFIGICLAPIYSTWTFSLGVGGLNVLMYIIAKFLIPNKFIARLIVSSIFAIFMLQFIGQMHGMAEMHFVFFTNIAILILYQDWRVMIPYTILTVLHHSLFFFFQLQGVEGLGIYFINYTEVDFQVLFFHYLWVVLMAVICGWWSVIFRQSQIQLYYKNLLLNEQKRELENQQEEIKQNVEELKTVQEQLEEKNVKSAKLLTDVNASITYAKRIQSALMPMPEDLGKLFPQSFIYYQPKDIVSGDFYWFTKKGNLTYLVAGDCTGHGVPGAFLSVIALEALNIIINIMGFDSPDFILSQLSLNIYSKLNRTNSDVKAGMDIAVCIIDHQKQTLQYSGAKMPLYLIQEGEGGEARFIEVKGNRKSIGYSEKQELYLYDNHTFDISMPTTFYLSSDGYQDQFGGENNTKFMSKRFKKLLFDIHGKSPQEQQYLLEETMLKWQGENKQIDDILIIGVKL
jgi:serine phosphatase RsbU (regulator of sigma subunit)